MYISVGRTTTRLGGILNNNSASVSIRLRSCDYARSMTYYTPPHLYPPPYQEYEENPGTGLGIVAFVCSLILWPVGLILSLMSRTQSRHAGRRMTGLAQAALILSLVAGFFSLLLLSGLLFWHLTPGTGYAVPPQVDVTVIETATNAPG